jgi:DNA polymerase sigma
MPYIDQAQYSNIDFYPNCSESLFKVHNELFTNINKEILEFENKVDSNLKKIKIYRIKVISEIKKFISEQLKENYEFELLYYGSYSTGLSIESSDIDILIKFKIISDEYKSSTQQNIDNIISLLENAFNQNEKKLNINQINPIYTASVPVIKIECNLKDIIPQEIQKELNEKYLFNFEHEILNLNMDLTFNEVNDIKEKQKIPSQEIIVYIKDKLNKYQNIRPLLLVLKRYMQVKKLNSSFHGGISSYSLFLLLYAYILQNKKKTNNNIESINDNLGNELFGFFSFYSNLNFEMYSIDIKKDNPIYLLDKPHENSIMLIDPITGLNVAKSTFRIEQIKYVFNNATMVLNNIFYEKINNITNDEDYNVLNELFNPFNSNNFFIPEDSSILEPF